MNERTTKQPFPSTPASPPSRAHPPPRPFSHLDGVQYELQNFPRSRAALSLLGYCYYHMSDFQRAMQTYEQLVKICPDVEEYKIYYSQSLFKAGMYPEATRSAVKVNSPQHTQRITMLQAR